jgi:hypothetical protein
MKIFIWNFLFGFYPRPVWAIYMIIFPLHRLASPFSSLPSVFLLDTSVLSGPDRLPAACAARRWRKVADDEAASGASERFAFRQVQTSRRRLAMTHRHG